MRTKVNIQWDLLIQDGVVVNADRTMSADVLIEGGTIREVRAGIDPAGAYGGRCAPDCLCCRAGSMRTRISTCRLAGRRRPMTLRRARGRRRLAGRRRSWTLRSRRRARRCATALDTWWKKAEGKACIDYGLHMIVTDLGTSGLEDMDDMVARGRGQLQAVHGVSRRADGGRRDDLQGDAADSEERRADLHACRERQRDRRDRAEGAGRGQDGSDLSRADAAHDCRGGGGASRDRDGGDWLGLRCTSCISRARMH